MYFWTDHENTCRIDRLDAVAVQDGRLLQFNSIQFSIQNTKAQPEFQKLHVFHTDQSLMNISHSPPTVQSLVIPAYLYTRVLYLPQTPSGLFYSSVRARLGLWPAQ